MPILNVFQCNFFKDVFRRPIKYDAYQLPSKNEVKRQIYNYTNTTHTQTHTHTHTPSSSLSLSLTLSHIDTHRGMKLSNCFWHVFYVTQQRSRWMYQNYETRCQFQQRFKGYAYVRIFRANVFSLLRIWLWTNFHR